MNRLKNMFLLCVMLMGYAGANASPINDAFVLVDVSGTMKNTQANNEARNIIQEILLGNFDISKWKGLGWDKNNAEDIIPQSILKPGSRFCLIPFGNIDRVKTRTKCTFENPESFNAYYLKNFPSEFHDSWTYLTLAKAFVGSVAITDNVKKAYVLIYTDGRPESTKETYDNYYQEIVDDLEYAGSNSFKKIGILRKQINSKIHYDVEIWEFTSYKTIGENGRNNDDDTPKTTSKNRSRQETIEITLPKTGKTEANPHKVTKNEEMKLQWTGGAGSIIVYSKDGGKYKMVPSRNSKEYFRKTTNGTIAKMTFFKSADYKIEVRGNGSSDTLFVRVSTPIVPTLLTVLLILGIIVAAIVAVKKITSRNDNTNQSTESGNKRNNDNLDW